MRPANLDWCGGSASNITAAIRPPHRDAADALATVAGPLLSLYRPLEIVLGLKLQAAPDDLGEIHRGMPFLLCFHRRGQLHD